MSLISNNMQNLENFKKDFQDLLQEIRNTDPKYIPESFNLQKILKELINVKKKIDDLQKANNDNNNNTNKKLRENIGKIDKQIQQTMRSQSTDKIKMIRQLMKKKQELISKDQQINKNNVKEKKYINEKAFNKSHKQLEQYNVLKKQKTDLSEQLIQPLIDTITKKNNREHLDEMKQLGEYNFLDNAQKASLNNIEKYGIITDELVDKILKFLEKLSQDNFKTFRSNLVNNYNNIDNLMQNANKDNNEQKNTKSYNLGLFNLEDKFDALMSEYFDESNNESYGNRSNNELINSESILDLIDGFSNDSFFNETALIYLTNQFINQGILNKNPLLTELDYTGKFKFLENSNLEKLIVLMLFHSFINYEAEGLNNNNSKFVSELVKQKLPELFFHLKSESTMDKNHEINMLINELRSEIYFDSGNSIANSVINKDIDDLLKKSLKEIMDGSPFFNNNLINSSTPENNLMPQISGLSSNQVNSNTNSNSSSKRKRNNNNNNNNRRNPPSLRLAGIRKKPSKKSSKKPRKKQSKKPSKKLSKNPSKKHSKKHSKKPSKKHSKKLKGGK